MDNQADFDYDFDLFHQSVFVSKGHFIFLSFGMDMYHQSPLLSLPLICQHNIVPNAV